MKKFIALIMSIMILTLTFTACKEKEPVYTKYSTILFNLFDTVISVVSYQESQQDFDEMTDYIENRYSELNNLFDIYNSYDGLNNIKTINDNAGIAPVKVQQEIIDLLEFSKEWYEKSNGKVNVAMGSVLKVWHNVRDEYTNNNGQATLPSLDLLKEKAKYTNIDAIEIDKENSTVYISDSNVSLDVGAVAKGFATEMICDELSEKYDNFAISAGGNVKGHGAPKDENRKRWGIGIQNPAVNEDYSMVGGNMDMAYINSDISIVCSGGYQRFMVIDGKRYHHLIDPVTLYPEEYYQGVSIICEDSGDADALSTAVFLMPVQEALDFINSIDDAECILVTLDGTVYATEGTKQYLASEGITAQTP